MEPSIVKAKIKTQHEELNQTRQYILNEIKSFVDYLYKTSNDKLPVFISADKKPHLLNISQISVLKVVLDTSNGTLVEFPDGTQFNVKFLPIEDLMELWRKLYYQ